MIPEQSSPHEPSDEFLCAQAAAGDRRAEETLVVRYNRLVRMCARPYFLAGGDSEDLIQEGMVGLLGAIREYDPDKAASFRTYAEVCVKNRLFSAVKAAARDKHTPLNNSVSFETPLFSGSGERFACGTPGRQAEDPEKRAAYEAAGCQVLIGPERDSHVDLDWLMGELGQREIDSILLEGGGTLNWAALEQGIVQKVLAYIAPKLAGGKDAKTPVEGTGIDRMARAVRLERSTVTQIGDDFLIESEVVPDVHRDR